ncbi:Bromodomain-containing protein [Diplocarpon rosae]|nr:Bromodomain-containing protein [Diplocarpon rosae]
MDKRKVKGGPVGEDLDDRAAKRRKVPNNDVDLSQGESAETTTQLGLKLVDTIRLTADKNGRKIATHFFSLPSRRQLPNYYEMIKMPIALDTIEAKLKRHEFPNLTTLESYFKRMISNAKEYNAKGSEIYEDSERLRKALSNYMTKHNPAYKLIDGYKPTPTPLPDPAESSHDAVSEEETARGVDHEVPISTKKGRGRPPKNSQHQRTSVTPALTNIAYSTDDYRGLSFQEAQEKFVEDLITQKEFPEDDIPVFLQFIDLPSKEEYADYYKTITHPVSLKTLKKGVRGIKGKYAATGISLYSTWSEFENEVKAIWENALKYNLDGSDIFLMAQELKSFFAKVFPEIKKIVPDGTASGTAPVAPPVRIRLMHNKSTTPAPVTGKKLFVKFGRSKEPKPAQSPTPQLIEPADGLVRTPPANGVSSRNPFASAVSSPNIEQLERAKSASVSVASPTPSNSALFKNEEVVRNSPASLVPYNNLRGPSQAITTPGMLTNSMLASTAPAQTNILNSAGYAQSFNHQAQSQSQSQFAASSLSFDSKWRQPGKSASDAMITNLSLATHPGLNISRHFRMDLPPSPAMAQQSITVNLPSTHYYLQIKPTIASSLLERQHKLFVTSGTQRLHAMPLIPGHPVDPSHPLFEARLLPGVNRIDIELIAALPRGSAKPANGQDAELEKITIFANLLRS